VCVGGGGGAEGVGMAAIEVSMINLIIALHELHSMFAHLEQTQGSCTYMLSMQVI
jgi:hypothetical protein